MNYDFVGPSRVYLMHDSNEIVIVSLGGFCIEAATKRTLRKVMVALKGNWYLDTCATYLGDL